MDITQQVWEDLRLKSHSVQDALYINPLLCIFLNLLSAFHVLKLQSVMVKETIASLKLQQACAVLG